MHAVGEGRLQQGFGCRAGEETGELDLEEQRERGRSAVSLPASVAGVCVFYTLIISNFLLNSIREHNLKPVRFTEL